MVAIATGIGEGTKEEGGEGSGGGCLLTKSCLSCVLKNVKGSSDSHRAEMGANRNTQVTNPNNAPPREGVLEKAKVREVGGGPCRPMASASNNLKLKANSSNLTSFKVVFIFSEVIQNAE